MSDPNIAPAISTEAPAEVTPVTSQTGQEFLDSAEQIKGDYVHNLIFTFKDEASQEDVDMALGMLRGLGELPGIKAWTVRTSIDNRKGRTALELFIFENGEAFLAFRQHPIHQEFANFVRNIADWIIVDYEDTQETVTGASTLGRISLQGAINQPEAS